MKKVLLVACNNLGIGGIQNVIMSITRSLGNKCQFDIIVFDQLATFYNEEFLKTGHGKMFIIPTRNRGTILERIDFYIRYFRIYRATKKIILENGPYDVVHAHNYFEAAPILAASKECGVPIRISHSHNSFPPNKRKKFLRNIYNAIYRKIIINNATDLLACSISAGNYLFGSGSKITVVPNAIDLKKFQYSPDTTGSPWSFIQVGRWCDQKNQLFTVELFANILKNHPEASLSLVGYGNDTARALIEKKLLELGVSKNVFFFPADSDILSLLKRNNIFLFPSIFEGLGIAIIEAQAIGMQCFASTVVPPETQLGLVEYLPLEAGSGFWASQIEAFVEKNGFFREKVDTSIYDPLHTTEMYKAIYFPTNAPPR